MVRSPMCSSHKPVPIKGMTQMKIGTCGTRSRSSRRKIAMPTIDTATGDVMATRLATKLATAFATELATMTAASDSLDTAASIGT